MVKHRSLSKKDSKEKKSRQMSRNRKSLSQEERKPNRRSGSRVKSRRQQKRRSSSKEKPRQQTSRKKSKFRVQSIELSGSKPRNWEQQGKTTEICVPAGDRVMDPKKKKMSRPYLVLIKLNTGDFRMVNQIKRSAEVYIEQQVKPDETGRYLGKYSLTKKVGSNDVLLAGGIEILKSNLHDHLRSKYGDLIGKHQTARVTNLSRSKNQIYSALELLPLSTKCD